MLRLQSPLQPKKTRKELNRIKAEKRDRIIQAIANICENNVAAKSVALQMASQGVSPILVSTGFAGQWAALVGAVGINGYSTNEEFIAALKKAL